MGKMSGTMTPSSATTMTITVIAGTIPTEPSSVVAVGLGAGSNALITLLDTVRVTVRDELHRQLPQPPVSMPPISVPLPSGQPEVAELRQMIPGLVSLSRGVSELGQITKGLRVTKSHDMQREQGANMCNRAGNCLCSKGQEPSHMVPLLIPNEPDLAPLPMSKEVGTSITT